MGTRFYWKGAASPRSLSGFLFPRFDALGLSTTPTFLTNNKRFFTFFFPHLTIFFTKNEKIICNYTARLMGFGEGGGFDLNGRKRREERERERETETERDRERENPKTTLPRARARACGLSPRPPHLDSHFSARELRCTARIFFF